MRWLLAVPGVLLVLPLAACGTGDDETLTVFAAASLTGVFDRLEEQYEADHPGVDVRISYGGSADLVSQLTDGAEADVLAAADTTTMDTLVAAGLADGDPTGFATNTLVIAVPPGNPAGVEQLADLAKPDLQLVLCAPEVPCGNAAAEVAERADLDLQPVSEEQSVTDVLAKVEAGEADAGLVYVTDVAAAGDRVEGIAFPESAAAINRYPVVVLAGSEHSANARAWLDLLLGDAGQRVLRDAGFGPPAS